jgi:hypothetical protein
MQTLVVTSNNGFEHPTGSGVTEKENMEGEVNTQGGLAQAKQGSLCHISSNTHPDTFREKHPWYNDMKGLMAECLNLKPHGIRHSQGGFNPAVLASGAGTPDDNNKNDEARDNWAESPVGFHDSDGDDEHAPHARLPLTGHRPSVGADGEEVPEPALPPPMCNHLHSSSLSLDKLKNIPTPATPAKAPSKGNKGRSTPACANTVKPAGKNNKHNRKSMKTGGTSKWFTNTVTEENAMQREIIKTCRANADTVAELLKVKIYTSTRLKELC